MKYCIAKKIGMSRYLTESGDMVSCTILQFKNSEYAEFFDGFDFFDVRSRSIGKGFAGPMKRHNFSGLRATHGVSVSHRSHGSTGQCQDPGKVFKGKKMAGHMGDRNVTVQNVKLLNVDKDHNFVVMRGSIPGAKGSEAFVKRAVKKYGEAPWDYTPVTADKAKAAPVEADVKATTPKSSQNKKEA